MLNKMATSEYWSGDITNTKNKKNNREFFKTVRNKLEWIFRPYVQGLSSAIQIRKKNNLQEDKINKTKMNSFSKQSQHPYLSEVQPGLINKLLWNEEIHWNETKWFKNTLLMPA